RHRLLSVDRAARGTRPAPGGFPAPGTLGRHHREAARHTARVCGGAAGLLGIERAAVGGGAAGALRPDGSVEGAVTDHVAIRTGPTCRPRQTPHATAPSSGSARRATAASWPSRSR